MKNTIIITLAILLAIYNGFFITGNSQAWHTTGFIIRLLLGILFVINAKGLSFWFKTALYFTLAWTLYDIPINLMMGMPWNHTGTTAFIDTTIPIWLTQILKFISAFATITLGALLTERWFKKRIDRSGSW